LIWGIVLRTQAWYKEPLNNNVDRSSYAFDGKTLIHITMYFYERELLNDVGQLYTDCVQGGSVYVAVKDGVLQQGHCTPFDSLDAAEDYVARLTGFRDITDGEAEALMMSAELPPLPPMPAGMVPGTLAHTAWLMVQTGCLTGDEADCWKDEMKDSY
jgi:hypothetical protein